MKAHKYLLASVLMFSITTAWAVPLVESGQAISPDDVTDDEAVTSLAPAPRRVAQAPMSLEQRVNVVQQSVENMTQMDLPGQIEALQQQVQELRGQLEVMQHQLQVVTEQQKQQFSDIDQRLSNVSTTSATTVPVPETTMTRQLSAEPVTPEAQEKNTYEAAFGLVKDKQYPQAIKAFTTFLTIYPDGDYAANAHYWLGQLYSAQNQPEDAEKELNIVLDKFPSSPKVADAMLKLGMMYKTDGHEDEAQKLFQHIIKKYPNTTSAHLAQAQLEE